MTQKSSSQPAVKSLGDLSQLIVVPSDENVSDATPVAAAPKKVGFQGRVIVIGGNTATILEKFNDGGKVINGPFVTKVEWDGGSWSWIADNYPQYTKGIYHVADDQHLLAIVIKNEIVDVLDLAKIDHYVVVQLGKDGPIYDGRGQKVTDAIALKKRVAKAMNLHFRLTASEEAVNAMKMAQVKAAKDAEAKAAEAKAAADKAERTRLNQEVRAKINARPRLKGYTGANFDQYFNGLPVVGDEWLKMLDGFHGVLVSSYNDDTRTPGDILGCFIVKKDGNRKSKTAEGEFSQKQGVRQELSVKTLGKVVYVDEDDDPAEVSVYGTKADVTVLRHAGLNSGTIVAVKTDDEGKFDLYSVTKTQVKLSRTGVNGAFFPLK